MRGWLRNDTTFRHSVVIGAAFLLLLRASVVLAQAQAPTPEVESPSAPPAPSVTSEQIDAELKLVEESTELDDVAKAKSKELLAQTQAALALAADETKKSDQFRAWIASAADDIARAKNQLDAPPEPFDFKQTQFWDLNKLVASGAQLTQQLTDARAKLSEAQTELPRRSARKAEIATALAAARAELATIEAEQKALPSDTGPGNGRVKALQLASRRQAALATIESMENERKAYEAQGELPRLRSEITEKLVAQLSKDVERLNSVIAEKRRGDAQAQKDEAQAALESAPDLLKPYAQKTIDRADERIQRASELQHAMSKGAEIAEGLQLWRDDFQRTKARVKDGASTTLGIVLLKKMSNLPDTLQYRSEIDKRVRDIRSIQGELLELEDRRAELKNVETAAGTTIANLRGKGKRIPQDAGDELVRIYQLESRILADLHDDTESYFGRLVTENEDQEALAIELEGYREFINEHVFWFRSTAPLQIGDLFNAGEAFAWLASSENWQDLADALQVGSRPWGRYAIAAACIVLLLAFRRRFRKQIAKLGETASARLCREFSPTLQVLPLTLLVAALLPALFLLASWILAAAPTEFPIAVSASLATVAGALFSAMLTMEVCRTGGLAETHLGWPPRALTIVRSNLRLAILTGTPLLFLVALLAHQSNPLLKTSAAQLCHVALMVLAAFVLHRIFRPQGGVFEDIAPKGPCGWLNRHRSICHTVLVLLPAGLALLSSLGFYYTARQLSNDLFRSFELVFWLLVTEGILYRWVRVKRRQLRWQQLIDARQRQVSGEETQKDDLTALAAEEEGVDLGEIDQKTRRLIDSSIAIIGLIGLWSIWTNVLPALGFLDNYALWSVATAEGVTQSISIADLVFAFLVATFTFAAAKNIPGLIDITLLDRLTLESSLRYAVSTVCQYAIAIVGALVAFHLIGIRWENAQWLVAALSVGLGFGLQEVVANFVCGILLLFERPIRVGDTVTLGETTGVVIRIRSRATTVRNWDRQEVVVPNKELITGQGRPTNNLPVFCPLTLPSPPDQSRQSEPWSAHL
jgi:potassium efflux system protein